MGVAREAEVGGQQCDGCMLCFLRGCWFLFFNVGNLFVFYMTILFDLFLM